MATGRHSPFLYSTASTFGLSAGLATAVRDALAPPRSRRLVLAAVPAWILDLLLFHILWSSGWQLAAAHFASFFASAPIVYLLTARWALPSAPESPRRELRPLRFLAVSLLVLFLRGGVLAACYQRLSWPPSAALGAAIVVAGGLGLVACALYVSPPPSARDGALGWQLAAVGLVAYAALLRLVYLGLPDLSPQEAYYWNYAQHPALGYLDHPPMVAWLIWAGTALLGDTELGVRMASWACWLVAAGFLFAFARNLYDETTALKTVMLSAALPFFLVVGFLATPDAPLVASWCGALFFLERALLAEQRIAWWGVGACIGLGMLSKYTMVLLAGAVVAFVLLDRRSRRWLARPAPYGGALLSVALFLPVVVWNARHEWASFAFQGMRRLTESRAFGLHVLLGWAVVLLTPIGLLAALAAMRRRHGEDGTGTEVHSKRVRRRRFELVLTLVPLAVLALFSVGHLTKPNWVGPPWLALLPAVAHALPVAGRRRGFLAAALGSRAWTTTLVLSLLCAGFAAHYLTLDIPGASWMTGGSLSPAWEELGRDVGSIANAVEAESLPPGEEVLVVGLDRYFTASILAFYRSDDDRGVESTASSHLFSAEGLMYEFWFPAERQRGRTLLLVSLRRSKMADERYLNRVGRLGPIRTRVIEKFGRPVLRYYYRVAEDYRE